MVAVIVEAQCFKGRILTYLSMGQALDSLFIQGDYVNAVTITARLPAISPEPTANRMLFKFTIKLSLIIQFHAVMLLTHAGLVFSSSA
jgi:hypothetical protein